MLLKRGSTKCAYCRGALLWHQMHGMRLVEEAEGVQFYRAICDKCGTYFKVRK